MSLHFIQRITFLAGILILDAAITCCHVKQPDDTRDPSRQASTDNPNLDNREIEIEYFGQSCFLLTTPANTRILTDPVEFKGYHLPTGTEAGIVTISHNHPDHNRADLVAGNPVILRGTSPDLQRVNQIDETIRDVRIYTVPSYHSPGPRSFHASNDSESSSVASLKTSSASSHLY